MSSREEDGGVYSPRNADREIFGSSDDPFLTLTSAGLQATLEEAVDLHLTRRGTVGSREQTLQALRDRVWYGSNFQ